ncbi:alanine:cation symporter family protein [bacterium]|nr:alanine:cation symporter family protein [bacterium]
MLLSTTLLALPVQATGLWEAFDSWVGNLNGVIAGVFFFNVLGFIDGANLPLAVAWLVAGAVFFTVRFGFLPFKIFKHAIKVTAGRYDEGDDEGEVTHFQALAAALSATVGLGNIAGVAIAVSIGGPGATFWMIIAGLLGMSSKMAECTAAQMFRRIRPDGKVMGGAMEYLWRGIGKGESSGSKIGKFLAFAFCILCVLASLGGGNAFQVNQSMHAFNDSFPYLVDHPWIYGIIMAVCVGVVIIGGIKSIAKTAEKIVPFMCGLYVAACLFILIRHFGAIPDAFGIIISNAFNFDAGFGGFIGVLVMGFQRAAFSNEAGIGSAAIAHSAAKTRYPAREGVVATLEPFIDTIVVCTMTALVIVITRAYENPAYAEIIASKQGSVLTAQAFAEEISWFPYVLSVAIVLFAYSTMISWSYYGERCWTFIFGEKWSMIYKIGFIAVIILSTLSSATNVLDFSDLMLLGMAFPNILGLYFMHNKLAKELGGYYKKLKKGEFKEIKKV